jgi:hypothetical protein
VNSCYLPPWCQLCHRLPNSRPRPTLLEHNTSSARAGTERERPAVNFFHMVAANACKTIPALANKTKQPPTLMPLPTLHEASTHSASATTATILYGTRNPSQVLSATRNHQALLGRSGHTWRPCCRLAVSACNTKRTSRYFSNSPPAKTATPATHTAHSTGGRGASTRRC